MVDEIEVVRRNETKSGATTSGVTRQMAFDVPGALFSKTIIEPKSVSSWHRHGERQLLGYVLSGCLRLECAESSVEVASGDFFRIPVGLIHRDVNPEASSSAVIVNLLLGEGEIVVNVGSQSG